MTIEPKQQVVSIRLNWRAYFKEFCTKHGGDPIVRDNRLLFKDGWMYSAYDFAGPEYRPPDDPRRLQQLQFTYWAKRSIIVERECRRLCKQRDAMLQFQSAKSVPLQQAVVIVSEEGKRDVLMQDLDLSMFEGRILWLEADHKECQKQINQLSEKEPENATI